MRSLILAVLIPLFLIQHVDSAAVISIDLGAEWMKIGIVSPGVPMEIVLNKESKRKTPMVMALRDGVRTFGEDAVNVGIRFPKNSYKFVLDLLGKSYSHPMVQLYKERFPYYDIKEDEERGTPVFVHDENTSFTPEEIIAQFLGKAKEFAEISAGQPVTECVIAVPGFFNQDERHAVLNAAQLASLKVLQLINDYSAIGINYGIFRRKEINESASHYMFFDMGAYSTKAVVVEYKVVKTKEKGFVETVPQMQIVGVGYDRTLGGLEVTLRLQEHLVSKWLASGGPDVRGNPRSMEKLLREAERVKTVLSANTEHYAQIEGLIDEKDFRQLVTRAELEEVCEDLWPRVVSVIERARAAAGGAGLGAPIVVAGAGARVPRIASVLRDAGDGTEPLRGINADEAATLGAVYRAAALAKGYRVATMIVRDAVILPIQVTFKREVDGNERLVKRTLFGHMNQYPQKKVITFNKHTDDFSFNVNYAELDHLPRDELPNIGALNLTRVTLKGVAEALNKNQGPNIESKGIKAHFVMDDSGLLSLANVEFVAEKTVSPEEEEDEESSLSKLGSTISKLFGSDSSDIKAEQKPTEPEREATPEAEQNDTTGGNTTTPPTVEKINLTEGAENKTVKPKIIVLKEAVATQEEPLSLTPLSPDQIVSAEAKIKVLDTIDRKRTERETALNTLESFVIDVQSKLDGEEYSDSGTPEQVEEIRAACSQLSEWLYDDGYDATTEVYREKLADLRKKTDPLFGRAWEHRERPEALEAMKSLLNQSRGFLKKAQNFTKDTNSDKDIFTDVEIQVLNQKIEDTEKWTARTLKEQNALKKSDNVVMTIDSIKDKMAALDREVMYLINKMKIWKPKKLPTPKTDKNKTEETKPMEEIKIEEQSNADKETKPEEEEEAKPEEMTTEKTLELDGAVGSEPAAEATDIPAKQEGEDKHSEL